MISKFRPDIVLSDETVILDNYGDFHYPHRDLKEDTAITMRFMHVDIHGDLYHDSEYAYMINENEYYTETKIFIFGV